LEFYHIACVIETGMSVLPPPPLNHVRSRALSCILRGAGPTFPPSMGRGKRGFRYQGKATGI
jgi:hypothetical protein